MIFNRRSLLAAIGLSLSAASAEAATKKKTPKPKPLHTHKVAGRKPAHHSTKPASPAA